MNEKLFARECLGDVALMIPAHVYAEADTLADASCENLVGSLILPDRGPFMFSTDAGESRVQCTYGYPCSCADTGPIPRATPLPGSTPVLNLPKALNPIP